ncbi:MAG TPA: amino acid adenylation domain-containing protein [Phycisphaerae bacterium]|nr:amino acid adenylation domain-containing protein [Phycisphaerae bacterium]
MPEFLTLYSLLEQAEARLGSCVAIDFAGRRLTYGELLRAAEEAADGLRERGARPGERVAFCHKKSIDAIVSLFGIIRTGATYVPIDPSWPAERVAAIVEDAGIRIWSGSSGPPGGISGIEIVSARDGREFARESASLPDRGIANILYTSGSTGRPKGVEITTRSLAHFSDWAVAYFELTSEDRVANHAPYNFDLSTFDIFAAVHAGSAMCPVPESLKMFPYQVAKFIAERRISVWYSVPSALVMMQLRGKLAEHDLSRLRHVIFAGEVMPKPALQALGRELPHVTWTNLYGPTETNVCTHHRCTDADFNDDGPVPIGRPISDTKLWIMNSDGEPADEGESGELWVAGPTVTTGYFGDHDLTASRCVAAPQGDGHCFRTGDRVRRRADGALMFGGRIDRMIKCRGHRIEPGEIEAALHRHPAVKQAAVVPLADAVFGNRLRACVSSKEGMALDEPGLVAFCRPLIPPYMMPDEWHLYEHLPQTDRGKIDLQALAAYPHSSTGVSRPPRRVNSDAEDAE